MCFKNYIKSFFLNDKHIGKYYVNLYPNSKYSIDNILNDILYVLKTGITWRDLKSIVNWQSVYFHFKRFVTNNIFKKLYIELRNTYFAKNKNCNKISILTDIKGIPLSILFNSGNVHDISFVKKHINDVYYVNKKYNRYNIILADKAYESSKLRDSLYKFNYLMMIQNKHNSTNKYYFNKQFYKNRIHVEHTFQKLKLFRKIFIRYDSLLITYIAFTYLAISQILFKSL